MLKKIDKSQIPLHLKDKSEEIKNLFISTINSCIDKGMNYSMSSSKAFAAVQELEDKLKQDTKKEDYSNQLFEAIKKNTVSIKPAVIIEKAVEEQVQFTAARYVPTGTKFRFVVWGDATVTLQSTDLSAATGTITIPSIRLTLA